MSQNGYHTALYVSDLTSAGTGQPQIFSAGAFGSPLSPLPQTQTIQVQNADGTSSTAQVTTLSSSSSSSAVDGKQSSSPLTLSSSSSSTNPNTNSGLGSSSGPDANPNAFLAANLPALPHDQISSVVSASAIPASTTSVIFKAAGAPY